MRHVAEIGPPLSTGVECMKTVVAQNSLTQFLLGIK